jgi:hypothetical protein
MKRLGVTEIRADHVDGYDRPLQIGSHIPDVTGVFGQRSWVVECETVESVADPHTSEQWASFAQHSRRTGSVFAVAVPHAARADAVRLLGSVGGNAGNVWSF